jgi:hypothetical protein
MKKIQPEPTPTMDLKRQNQNFKECWELIKEGLEKRKIKKSVNLFGNQ